MARPSKYKANYGTNPYQRGYCDGMNDALKRQKFREQEVMTIQEMTASFGIALKNTTSLENDEIADILREVQSVWNASVNENFNVLDRFRDLTGLDIGKEF